ncbi:MAG TPA: VOC family protein [Caulobacteraceae bacterium]|jgi:catechol 2,3-dioxygenase-like lactoylglutathione lyase family enzyme|nr:VOC family protein [Caulobacteraceae bacterium]
MAEVALADRQAQRLEELPARLHHHAFTVRDQEVNRHFMEDILGVPLVATWCERTFRPEVGREVDYCHTFYEMADGSALAFFQWADDEAYALNRAILHSSGSGTWHIAFKASRKTLDEMERRLKAAGVPHRVTDHGYCLSLYVRTPDGLRLEFAVDAPDVEEIAAMRRADAHAELSRWLGGDRRPNNDDRAH